MRRQLLLIVLLLFFTVSAWGENIVSALPLPTITVDSPNGGEVVTAGTRQAVSWHYTGNPGPYVKIELLQGDALNRRIASMVPITSRAFNWKVRSDQTPGSDYRIKVSSVSKPFYSDISDNNFSIAVFPRITIDSPNGGEVLTAGTDQTVSWHYTGNPGTHVNIELRQEGVLDYRIVSMVPITPGTFNWRVPSDQTPGSNYKIRVSSVSNPSCRDNSDSSFKIIAEGHVTDPLGDAFSSSHATASPDIVDIKTIADGSDVTFQIRFAPLSFDASKDLITFFIDADRNVDTGAKSSGLGIDFVVFMGSDAYGPIASFEHLTGTPDNIVIGSAPVTFLSDGMDVTFPLSYFQLQGRGNLTSFDYRSAVSIQIAENSFTGNIDMAPDGSLPPASSNSNSFHDTLTPIPTEWTADYILFWIKEININAPNQNPGHLARWAVPIEVNTAGLARVEQALTRYEIMTGGLITFNRVNVMPANGVIFVEGVAVDSDGVSPGCGNVSNVPGGAGVNFAFDASGSMTGLYYINLGSVACNDATKGNYESAIAEHELGHVLGVWGHFDGYTGDQGLMDPNYFNVIYNIYNNPIGTTAGGLDISVVSVGQFGFYY